MDYPLISREAAKAAGLKRYFTGAACSRGHVAERQVSNGSCCECMKMASHKYKQTPKGAARQKAYQQTDEYKAYRKEYHASEAYKEVSRKYEQSVKGKATNKAYKESAAGAVTEERYREANPHVRAAGNVAWHYPDAIIPLTDAEQSRMRWFYTSARELSKRTGVKFHVDHCYPLALGGLHHPLNLMILPAWVNIQKRSKFQPDNPLAVRGLHLKDRLSLRIQQP